MNISIILRIFICINALIKVPLNLLINIDIITVMNFSLNSKYVCVLIYLQAYIVFSKIYVNV